MSRLKKITNLAENADHAFDDYTSLGYNYNKSLLARVLSPELFGNPLNDTPLRQIEKLIQFLINQVKRIKLHYSFAIDKKDINLIN